MHGWIATGSLAQADEDKEAKKAKGDAESGWFINVYNGKIWEILLKMDDFGGTSMTQRKPFQQIRWETSANIGAFTGMMLMTYGLMPLRS